MPPKGAISQWNFGEMMPSLMPTTPYSGASAELMSAVVFSGICASSPLACALCSKRPGAELQRPPAQSAVRDLLERLSREPVTLLFADRDETRNNATALRSPPLSPAQSR
jgi:hypothetical protein